MSTNKSATERINFKDYTIRALIHSAVGCALLAIVSYSLINDKIDFSRYQKTRAQDLKDVGSRIQYVLQQSTPGVVWLLFCTFYVISKRVGTPAVIPTLGYEYLTESAKNIFLNTLEMFVMTLFSQLILATYLTPKQVLNVIPVINLLFITGRIFFWLGYPMRRAFGYTLNFVPLLASMAYISYRYFYLFF